MHYGGEEQIAARRGHRWKCFRCHHSGISMEAVLLHNLISSEAQVRATGASSVLAAPTKQQRSSGAPQASLAQDSPRGTTAVDRFSMRGVYSMRNGNATV